MPDDQPLDAPSETLASLLRQRVAQSGDQPALTHWSGAAWQTVSWNELAADVHRVASGLLSHGIQAGDRVVQVSENRYEWIVADQALLSIGAVHVSLHVSLASPELVAQIEHCEARAVLLAGPPQADKLREIRAEQAAGLRWFAWEPVPRGLAGQRVLGWQDLLSGRQDLLAGSAAEAVASEPVPDQLAAIIYTSGTVGEPRGVMLTHGNLAFNMRQTLSRFDEHAGDVRLNFLPLSHAFARTCDLYTWIGGGSRLVLARSRETLLEDLAHWQPTLLNGVPLFYERMLRLLRQRGVAQRPGSVRQLLGGRVRLCCCGGAALPEEVYDYYLSQDVPVLQGYGLTETSPVISLSTPARHRRGSIGQPLPGVEVRLAEDGELLTRGPHVMRGYYRNEEAAREMLRDGWLHTGDLARQDDDGFLYLTGRKREILVTSGGKNVSPTRLEMLLNQDPLIHQSLVVGDGRDYLTALIVPDPDTLRARIKAARILLFSRRSALRHRRVLAMYAECLRQRLRDLAPHEQIRRFTLLGRAFSIEAGELTPKLSLRRRVIEAHFRAEIESLYGRSA
ncbi:MAG: long-chain fatty acid--CoA ligase [Pirellulaceae bacterium]|nr:long-chain fatty acid--CoA ligase [Pirellulaceae bacterium]